MTVAARFITLEGIDGAGKSTQLPILRALLEARGHTVWTTREPGGTPLGERLRELLLRETMAPMTEALLMFAARREHCEREIWPRLRERKVSVLCDRFSDATYAYQGGGYGLPIESIRALESAAIGDFRPDCTFVFDVPVAVGKERLASARELDKYERQQWAFFERVRATYLQRAAAEPARYRVIDGARPPDVIRDELAQIVASL